MRIVAGLSALFLILGSPAALAQDATSAFRLLDENGNARQRCYWFERRSKSRYLLGLMNFRATSPPIKYRNSRTARRL